MALRKVLMRHQQTLEYRILRWKFEQNFVPTPRENWMQKVTLPSSLGIILILGNKIKLAVLFKFTAFKLCIQMRIHSSFIIFSNWNFGSAGIDSHKG